VVCITNIDWKKWRHERAKTQSDELFAEHTQRFPRSGFFTDYPSKKVGFGLKFRGADGKPTE